MPSSCVLQVSMRMEHFLRSAKSLTDFPLEYLHGLRELGKNMAESGKLPESLLLCLGVLPIPGASDSYLALAWPELKMSSTISRRIDGAGVVRRAMTYVSDIIRTASKAIDQRARELWVDPEQLSKCKLCASRGMFALRAFTPA